MSILPKRCCISTMSHQEAHNVNSIHFFKKYDLNWSVVLGVINLICSMVLAATNDCCLSIGQELQNDFIIISLLLHLLFEILYGDSKI